MDGNLQNAADYNFSLQDQIIQEREPNEEESQLSEKFDSGNKKTATI